MARASNFTDRQKAELFVRDHATCAYTGKSLWLLDYGADPYFEVDWADHRKPVARGGTSTLANGVCASWGANFAKSDSLKRHPCMFRSGSATPAYLRDHCSSVPLRMQRQLARFSRLHYSDWYFNRALFRLWLGVAFLAAKDAGRVRDDAYYCRASSRMLEQWRRITTASVIPSLETRGLVPRRLRPNQRLMLDVREVESIEGIAAIMRKLVPFYAARL
jgi:hypothetical protein